MSIWGSKVVEPGSYLLPVFLCHRIKPLHLTGETQRIRWSFLFASFILDLKRNNYGGTQGSLIRWPVPFSNPSAVPAGCRPCSRHEDSGFAPAAPLTSTLDEHHGAKTQKENNLALRAVLKHGFKSGALDLKGRGPTTNLKSSVVFLLTRSPAAGFSK